VQELEAPKALGLFLGESEPDRDDGRCERGSSGGGGSGFGGGRR
jgi:hypothetical protein